MGTQVRRRVRDIRQSRIYYRRNKGEMEGKGLMCSPFNNLHTLE